MADAPRTPPLSPLGEEVRRHDRDRFMTALFAPADRREDLFALYAFNAEVAGIREKVTEPMMGLMRLQFWRDTLDSIYGGGAAPVHPTARGLAVAVQRRSLPRAPFDTLLDAREADMEEEPPADRAAFLAYSRGTGGSLQRLAAAVLADPTASGGATAEAAEAVGTAWAVVGLLRAVAFHAALGRVTLPASDLAEQGVDRHVVATGVPHDGVAAVARALSGEAADLLAAARRHRRAVPKAAVPALLPAVLADGYLRRLSRLGYNVFHPDLATIDSRPIRLTLSALTGRY